ncbi:hypothetical protein HPG69_010885 [Diceros bicornis minor]|uniref:Uncharacterized protein n=1 Tax=Diceros bicornis minor TaxID=77932 RepID=A0A7J7EGC3_DICBM|nr:hypothetical protein HPG69_010885 [Diceros bicornis minor]
MGAGSSTEQRSPEQPEAGSATPAEPEPGSGGPAAEAAPGAPGDPAVAAPDPATKVRARRATCPGEAGVGGGGGPSDFCLRELPTRPARLQTREHALLFLGFSGGSFAPGREQSSSQRGGGLASLSWVSRGGDCAIRSNKIRVLPAANRASLHTLPVGTTQPETDGLPAGVPGELAHGRSVSSPRPPLSPGCGKSAVGP